MRRAVLAVILLVAFVSPAFSKSYSINDVSVKVNVSQNGLVNVFEQMTYNFNGCYSEVYRYIPLFKGESIVNFTGATQSPAVIQYSNPTGVFQANVIFSQPDCSKQEVVEYNYSMSGVAHSLSDTSEINFQFWGPDWPAINSLTAQITLPGGINSSEFWLKPFYGVQAHYQAFKNSYLVTASNLPAGQWLEFRAIFPKNSGAYYLNASGSALGVKNDMANQKNVNFIFYILSLLSWVLAALPIIFAAIIYYMYGREPSVDYFKTYENEPPTSDAPAVVNALMKMASGAQPDKNGFLAGIFDLVVKGYAKISEIKKTEKTLLGSKIKEDFVITFKDSKQELSSHERKILEYMKSVSTNGKLAWSSFIDRIKTREGSAELQPVFEVWKSRVMSSFKTEDYYIKKGNMIMLVFSFVFILIPSIIILLLEKTSYAYPALGFTLPLAVTAVLSAGLLVLNLAIGPAIFGHRTKKGTLFFKQWSAFEKFIADFSMIKQYPPESVKIWEKFLVYSIALGKADAVIKAMKQFKVSTSLDPIVYYPGFYYGFALAWTMNPGFGAGLGGFRGGGFGGGGFGGGSGGGGGGAH